MASANVKKNEKTFQLRPSALALAVSACFAFGTVQAMPSGANVVAGSAQIKQSGNKLTVTNTPGAIINWSNFSVGAIETVKFQQQNSLSSVLNRVTGTAASDIQGSLLSNGRVYLINPNGILFGPNSTINVNGLIASTLDISNQDFTNGKLNFSTSGNAGNLKNAGVITAAQNIYLIAPDIENTGILKSDNGEIILAAGRQVTLVDGAHPDIQIVVSAPADKALNLGDLTAGRISIFGALIQQKGRINADRAEVDDKGRIVLKASKQLELDANSQTTANGKQGGDISLQTTEGDITVSGLVTANGSTKAGGTITITAPQTIELTTASRVEADGAQGGHIVAMTKDANGLSGKLTAQGELSAQGNGTTNSGGFIETSGATVNLNGIRVYTKNGTWLLDPHDLDISASGDVTPGAIQTALDGGSDVTIQTDGSDTPICTGVACGTIAGGTVGGDINVNGAITWTSNNTLTLNADNDINVNASISGTSGQLSLMSGGNILKSAGYISVDKLKAIAAGDITLAGSSNQIATLAAQAGGAIVIENGTVSLNIGTVGGLSGVTAVGDVAIRQYTSGGITVSEGVESAAGNVLLGVASGTGNLTVNNTVASQSATQIYTSSASSGSVVVTDEVEGGSSVSVYSGTGGISTSGSGFVTAPTISLQNGSMSTGSIGSAGASFKTCANSACDDSSSSTIYIGVSGYGANAAYLTHYGNASIDQVYLSGASAPITIKTSGNLAMGTYIYAGSGNSGDITLAAGAGKSLTLSSSANYYGGNITLEADSISLNGAHLGDGSATSVMFNPATVGASVVVGSGVASNTLYLSPSDLVGAVRVDYSGGKLVIGDTTNTGTLSVTSAFDATDSAFGYHVSPALLVLSAGSGGITQTAEISATNLALHSVGDIVLNTVANSVTNLAAEVTGSGKNISFKNSAALTIPASLDSLTGIATTNTGNISLNATDLTVSGLMSGNNVTVSTPTGVHIGLGVSSNMTISGAELQNITANQLTLSSYAGYDVNIGSITSANSANVGKIIVNAGGTANLGVSGAASSFKALEVHAQAGNVIAGNVTTTVGDLTLDSDSNSAGDWFDDLAFNGTYGAITLTATNGQLVLGDISRVNGAIGQGFDYISVPSNDLTLVGKGVTLNRAFVQQGTGSKKLTINAGSDGIQINKPLAATGGDLVMSSSSSGVIAQAASATITTANLYAEGYSVTLDQANLVGTLAGKANGGDFTFNNAQDLTIGTVNSFDGISADSSGGNISISTTDKSITINKPIITNCSASLIAITTNAPDAASTAAITNNAYSVITSNNITLEDLTYGSIGSSSSAPLYTSALAGGTTTFDIGSGYPDMVYINHSGNANLYNATMTYGAPFYFKASGDIALGASINEGSGDLTLWSTGGNLALGNYNLTGGTVALTANSITGGTGIVTGDTISLTANTGSIGASGTHIKINPATQISADTSSGTGGIYLTSTGAMPVGTINTNSSAVELTAGGAMTSNSAMIDGSTVSLSAAGDIGTSNFSLTVYGSTAVNANSSGHDIYLSGASILAGTISGSTVWLTASDNNISQAGSSLITANELHLSAFSGISASTRVGTLYAENYSSGDINILNNAPSATPAMLYVDLASNGASGVVNIESYGGITTGDLLVVGRETNGTRVPVYAYDGNVTLIAHSPIVIGAGGVSAGGTGGVSLTAGSGGSVTLNGNITSGGTTSITGGSLMGSGTVNGSSTSAFAATSGFTNNTPVVTPTAPTLEQCIADATLSGCSTVLPSLATCTSTPTTAGCSVVLPSLATCTATPTAAGCTAVLPDIATCTATPTAAGCTAVLPDIATCTVTPSAAGCTAVLPDIATCTATPSAAGCTAVLPSVADCTSNPSTAGCTAVLPSIATCTVTPSAAGCAAVLPSLATCTVTPSAAGCSAVLPTLDQCRANGNLPGCSVVLPVVNDGGDGSLIDNLACIIDNSCSNGDGGSNTDAPSQTVLTVLDNITQTEQTFVDTLTGDSTGTTSGTPEKPKQDENSETPPANGSTPAPGSGTGTYQRCGGGS